MSKIRAEDGGVLVAATIIIAVLVMLSVGVIQVGAWYQDRRHLQVRADAGALAGAQLFNECFVPAGSLPAGHTAGGDMEMAASQYAGFTKYKGNPLVGNFTPAYNTSENTGSNAAAFQSQTYPGGGGDAPDDTNTADECASNNLALDVKLTRDVGGIFSFSPLGHIHAHARVQLKEVKSITPSFPLAIPEVVPGAVAATFVNEDTGGELTGCTGTGLVTGTGCTFKLTNDAVGPDPFNLGPWDANGLGINFPTFAAGVVVKRIGVRIGVGDPAAIASCAGAGNGSTWACYNADGGTAHPHGAAMIAEINPTQANFPKLLSVTPTTCSGDPFAADPALTNPCAATLSANIDFNGVALNRITVTATVTGSTGTQTFTLQNQGGNVWSAPLATGTASIPVEAPTGGSEYPISLAWKITGNGGGNGSWGVVGRFVGATGDDDGPLDMVQLRDSSGTNPAYSVSGAGAHTVNVSVLLQAPFNKLTILRQSHSGSATAFIDCTWKTAPNPPTVPLGTIDNGKSKLIAAMGTGCEVPFQVNSTLSCDPDPLANPDKSNVPDCAQNEPSADAASTKKGLNDRLACSGGHTPYPNNWPNWAKNPGDKRLVTLITTTYGAFDSNGKGVYPVAGFGAFYIAGFSGNDCGDTWDAAVAAILGPDPGKNSGTIWGYFIKYTNLDGTPSGRACKTNSFQNCVAVLTR